MGRKGSKHGKHGESKSSSKSEKERLLKTMEEEENHSTLSIPSGKPDRKKSVWAPVATATNFEDVPIFTICPYCNQKCVTKTHFKRGRKNWYCCCCLPYFLDVFKDVIHSCPKCNKQIAIYNRFNFFKSQSKDTPSAVPSQTNINASSTDLNEITE